MAYRTDTLCGIFHSQALKYGDDFVFLMGKFDESGAPADNFKSITWKQARHQVLDLARGLITLGLEQGDTAAVFAENRPRWIIADQAIQACGAVGVPLYPTVSREELAFMIKDSRPGVIFTSTHEKAGIVLDIIQHDKKLKNIPVIVMGLRKGEMPENVYTFGQIMKEGREKLALDVVEERIQRVIPQDTASIIYTSGTTGRPKGVVLTQQNFISNIIQTTRSEFILRQKKRDLHLVSLVHLPLCHSYGRTTDYHVAGLYLGGVLAFAESYETIAKDLREIRPNVITSIPRFFEKTYDIIMANMSRQKPLYRKIFDWSMKQGMVYMNAMSQGKRISLVHLNMFGIANILVFDKLKKLMGMDRLVLAASGGGKLSKDVSAFFRALNIQLTEGYGLTETSPIINFNEPSIMDSGKHSFLYNMFYERIMEMTVTILVENQAKGISPYAKVSSALRLALCYLTVLYKLRIKPGTVGRPVAMTEEKLGPDGEILVKGPQVFTHYFNLPRETRDAFTKDGWFRTGDIGAFDEEGFLIITDRKKELFVTSGGKNIAPHPIELSLATRPYIDQVCLVGDGKKYLSALIVPDFKELARYANREGIAVRDNADMVSNPLINDLIARQVDVTNTTLARYEQIKYFKILDKPFTIESGELTPTLKVKRRVVFEKYRDQIQELYDH